METQLTAQAEKLNNFGTAIIDLTKTMKETNDLLGKQRLVEAFQRGQRHGRTALIASISAAFGAVTIPILEHFLTKWLPI